MVVDGKEIFDIPGYEGVYGITKAGEVWSYPKERGKARKGGWLKPHDNGNGYLQVGLTKDKKQKLKLIHRLLAETFIPNPNNYKTVDHIDRNTLNNSLQNLRWATSKTQIANRNVSIETQQKTAEKAREAHKTKIRCIETGIIYDSQIEASKEMEITPSLINSVLKGRQKLAKGYSWEYADEKEHEITKVQKGDYKHKRITQRDKDTNEIIKVFNSQKEASKETGIHQPNINQCLLGKIKTAGGYHWEYFEGSDKNFVFVDSKESEVRKEETNGKEFVSRSSIFRCKSLHGRQGR